MQVSLRSFASGRQLFTCPGFEQYNQMLQRFNLIEFGLFLCEKQARHIEGEQAA